MGNSCAKGAAGRSKPVLDLRSNATPAPKSDATPAPGEKTTSNATPSPGELATFKWAIHGFSLLLDKDQGWTRSAVFEMMGVKWYLKLNPKYKKINDEEEYVSLSLQQAQSSVKLDTVVEASFRLKIYDQSNGKHREQLVNHSFQIASTSSAISFMLPLKTLNEQPGFLVNNSCIFCIEFIKVDTIKASTTLETLYVSKMNVFNEAKVYTWEIEDFFALKNYTSYSPEFDIGGYAWYIHMYPSSDGNHLSLFLRMKKTNDLRKDSGNLVEVSLSIKNQENGKDCKLTDSVQFSSISLRWGWAQFIPLEDLKDPSKGYLIKGKCCIEAEVTINGSSKTEYSH